ncbi:MAG: aldehyde ferredoxin oxidoreductase [Candidatus Lokiarchaeota archaeon]|nr:aldehyde ferredoxin oxidoreductase [Candidatus Lokiarchaeota archaeon]MBD3340030.1 aldehyde ferredoxin oxidoreductase [Candidatus Lokiarchaeota archaeon]
MANFMGKILRINLTSKEITIESVREEDETKYIGGPGVAAAIFTREVSPDVDAFDKHNYLIFSAGPLCGTMVPFCGRHFLMAKSPLTGIIGESSAGGFFGREMRAAGYDHIIITGKSENPVYLWINDENVEIREAGDLWGKGIKESEKKIQTLVNESKAKVAVIGPAGENLVKYACIMSEEDHAAGRCGMGAVMGSKKLKGIAIRGTNKILASDKEKLKEPVNTLREMTKNSPMAQVMSELGTLVHMDNYVSAGDVPIKNFTESRWRGTKKIGAYAVKERGDVKHYGCFNCPVACRGKIKYNEEWVEWPEYEALAMIGSNLYVDDLEEIIKWNLIANDLGLDVISLGSTIAVFLESLERGLLDIDPEELGYEKDPENPEKYNIWGVTEPIEKIIRMIGERKDIGDRLALGVKQFCENSKLPDDLNVTGKGLEVPAHEPRANNMTALDYATTSRGAYHCFEPLHLSFVMNLKTDIGLSERIDPFSTGEELVSAVKKVQDASEAFIACGGCIFGFHMTSAVKPWIDSLNSVVGSSYSIEEWMKAGEEIFNLKRKYNLQCGITKEDDTVGSRFFTPIPKGGTKKNVPPLDLLVQDYYKLRKWDAEGRPQ